MIEIPPALTRPILEIVTPLYVRFSAPFLRTWEDIAVPYQNIRKNPQENSTKLVQNSLRIALSVAVFFVYQVTWSGGKHYLGRVGGLAALYAGMAVVCHLDPRVFYLSNSAWFLYKGMGILKGVEDGRLLCLLLVDQKKFDGDPGIFKFMPMQTVSASLAALLASFVQSPAAPPTSPLKPAELPQ